jgi:hypothetical protein
MYQSPFSGFLSHEVQSTSTETGVNEAGFGKRLSIFHISRRADKPFDYPGRPASV